MKTVSVIEWEFIKCFLNVMVTFIASNLRREFEFHLNKVISTEPNSMTEFEVHFLLL